MPVNLCFSHRSKRPLCRRWRVLDPRAAPAQARGVSRYADLKRQRRVGVDRRSSASNRASPEGIRGWAAHGGGAQRRHRGCPVPFATSSGLLCPRLPEQRALPSKTVRPERTELWTAETEPASAVVRARRGGRAMRAEYSSSGPVALYSAALAQSARGRFPAADPVSPPPKT